VRVLFDQGTPVPLRRYLAKHDVATAFELGWAQLRNGELLAVAESAGFNVFVTTDRNLRYQQNLDNRRIAIVVLSTPSWPRIRRSIEAVTNAVDAAGEASFSELNIP
jgi:hypothetical protein